MKNAASLLLIVLLAGPCLAVPLGGAGAERRERVAGSFEVSGQLIVSEINNNRPAIFTLKSGITNINSLKYSWPKEQFADSMLYNNGTGDLIWRKAAVPSGKNGALQYQKDGVFTADDNILWNYDQKKLSVAGNIDASALTQSGTQVSLAGHVHNAAEINAGILGVLNGGTGTDNGSINGSGELKLNAGGPANHVSITPSGTGMVIINGAGLQLTGGVVNASEDVKINAGGTDKNVIVTPSGKGSLILNGAGLMSGGPVRTETAFNVKGVSGADAVIDIMTDMRTNKGVLQKKSRRVTISGGIVTEVGNETDWYDAQNVAQ